ncbi:MAG: glycosyltransferase family 2 protein [Deltaproteobacteria bacterium]|nr:glycosyltransferase family 2 protein [Deltaproteobacteria bacterium]
MAAIEYVIVGAYIAVLLLLMVYCGHRYHILYLYFRHKDDGLSEPAAPERLPRVTIQLPVYNELYVIERLILAAAALEYPRELLEIQVLDDSTDDTSHIARQLADELRDSGYTITYLHRGQRTGYKAGALAAGLSLASGDLIAVFDADFVPQPDFLKRTAPYFADQKTGMVQTRWGHVNRSYSLLTRLQATLLDAHFMLEHTARSRSGRFFNFNGTAGMWRKRCIEDAGGWQHDTLTEDLDLSYRAQLKGWQFIYLPDTVTPAEIPVDMNSFKGQQHRWAKGGIETTCKLLPHILAGSQPLRVKLESFFHLTGNFNYLLVVALALLTYPALVIRIERGWTHLAACDLICFAVAGLPIALYYCIASMEVEKKWLPTFACLPLLMGLGIGLCINNGRGVFEALTGRRSAFIRTPKFKIESRRDTWRHKKYRGMTERVQVCLELGLGIYFIGAILFAFKSGVYMSVPFLSLFCFGFLYVGGLSLCQVCAGGKAVRDL